MSAADALDTMLATLIYVAGSALILVVIALAVTVVVGLVRAAIGDQGGGE